MNVFVSDLGRALELCRSKLGLELEHSAREHGVASLSAGPVRLGLAVPDLVAEHPRLSACGVEFPMPPTKRPWGGFMALVSDSDGNVLYLDQVSAVHS